MGFVAWLAGLCYAVTFKRESCTGPHLFDHGLHARYGAFRCCRCRQDRPALYPARCATHPERDDAARGHYACPDCGAPLLAGFPHPLMCRDCLLRLQPASKS
jgi:hypothetical protein